MFIAVGLAYASVHNCWDFHQARGVHTRSRSAVVQGVVHEVHSQISAITKGSGPSCPNVHSPLNARKVYSFFQTLFCLKIVCKGIYNQAQPYERGNALHNQRQTQTCTSMYKDA